MGIGEKVVSNIISHSILGCKSAKRVLTSYINIFVGLCQTHHMYLMICLVQS